MVAVASGIIFVNDDISPSVQEKMVTQLFIDYILTGDEFDANVSTDSTYPNQVKQFRKRILVIRSFDQGNIVNNIPNRELADIILFVANGLANVLTKSGHHPSFPIVNIHWGQFNIFE